MMLSGSAEHTESQPLTINVVVEDSEKKDDECGPPSKDSGILEDKVLIRLPEKNQSDIH